MSKTELGNKRLCAGCGARFYDLNKNLAPCPKCKLVNDIKAPVKIRRKSKAAAPIDNDDPLVKQKAKQDARGKIKKPSKNMADLEDFDHIATIDGEDEIEELDDIAILDGLEGSESEESMNDDITLDDDGIGEEAILDLIEDEEETDEEEELPDTSSKKTDVKKKR